MTSRELITRLFSGNSFDRVGVFEHFWVDTLQVWLGQGYPFVTSDGPAEATNEESYAVKISHVVPSELCERAAPAPVSPYHHFEFDMHPCGGGFDLEPIRGYEEVLEETDEWVIKRNGAGAVFRYWKHKSGTPEHIDFRMTSREIWERDYRPHLLMVDRERLKGGAFKNSTLSEDRAELQYARTTGKWAHFAHIGLWEVMRGSLGDLCMYESLLTDPGWIHDFNRVYTDFFKAHFEVLFEELGLPDGIWLYDDIAYRNGLFASPRTLHELFLPYYAELTDFFHSRGLPVILHSCGNVTQALPLIIEAGFDGLHPMEIKAGCNPFRFAEQYHDRLVLIGGLDVRMLETNDRQTIVRGVSDLIEGMKARGARYIFATDHSVTPLVHYDSYRLALDVYRQHMMY
ncbi:MAG: uroporphyrinogen decarboxylase family protein [Anaerolineae bacterium]